MGANPVYNYSEPNLILQGLQNAGRWKSAYRCHLALVKKVAGLLLLLIISSSETFDKRVLNWRNWWFEKGSKVTTQYQNNMIRHDYILRDENGGGMQIKAVFHRGNWYLARYYCEGNMKQLIFCKRLLQRGYSSDLLLSPANQFMGFTTIKGQRQSNYIYTDNSSLQNGKGKPIYFVTCFNSVP